LLFIGGKYPGGGARVRHSRAVWGEDRMPGTGYGLTPSVRDALTPR
jgi:hypothetical protein